jgi:hypothetical protein
LAKKPRATLAGVIGHARVWAVLLVLLPAVSRADVVEVPELGVKFSALPSGVSPFQVVERPAGYEAVAHLGRFSLSIYRLEEPVPAGADLRDARYRATLETTLGIKAGSLKQGETRRVGNDHGWTIPRPMTVQLGAVTLYSWWIYAIGNQHVYRLSVSGGGPTAADEFRSLLEGVYSIAFEPVQRAERPAPELAASAPGKMPRFVAGFDDDDFYPATARRLGEHGPVDVEFSIDGRGHVQDVRQTYAAVREFSTLAVQALNSGVFRVPTDWEATGSQKLRFTVEFQLSLVGPGQTCPGKQTPRVADAYVIMVCGSEIARH